MKETVIFLFFNVLFAGYSSGITTSNTENFYPEASERTVSKENITYYINPVAGSDKNTGTTKKAPWKTFKRVNQFILTKGNKVEILSPGTFGESLYLVGQGTTEAPITIQFAPGQYDFYLGKSFKSKFHISNTNDSPDSLKMVAIYLLNSKNIKIKGNQAEIVLRGKAIETSLNKCENISIEEISFDYKRPTVSEIRVLDVSDNYADVQIHNDSQYEIADSTLTWVGEGWKYKVQGYWQEFDPKTEKVKRKNLSVIGMTFNELAKNKVRIQHMYNGFYYFFSKFGSKMIEI